jgi:gluconokinase
MTAASGPESHTRKSVSAMVVMGVAGSGKSSVATALAAQINGTFIEGDTFHSPANIDKMRSGIPLNDMDRSGWIDRLAFELHESYLRNEVAVLACSALERSYRERLRRATPSLGFVFLKLSPETAAQRVTARNNHFMPASLIGSQFAALEVPVDEPLTLTIDGTLSLAEIVQAAKLWYLTGGSVGGSSCAEKDPV